MAGDRVGRSQANRLTWPDSFAGYAFVAPAMAMFLLFLAFPIGFSVWLSFHEWNGFTPIARAAFVGLDNFWALVDNNEGVENKCD